MPTEDAVPALRHVTHELRTRLAAATAAVEGLRDTSIDWSDEDRGELLAVAQTALENIRLVLAELSAAGSGLSVNVTAGDRGTDLRALVDAAVADLGGGIRRPRTHLPPSVPPVLGDPVVVRLVLVSVLRHALRDPRMRRLDVRGATVGDRVVLRIGGGAPVTDAWQRDVATGFGRPDREPPLDADVAVARDLAQLLGGRLRTAGHDERPGSRAVVLELPCGPPAPSH